MSSIDPVYRALRLSETDLRTGKSYEDQIKRAIFFDDIWNGQWSVFQHTKDTTPKHREGRLSDFLQEILNGLKDKEKDGHAICGSTFFEGSTRAVENAYQTHLIAIDYDQADESEITKWMNHQRLPGILVILHSSPSDGIKKLYINQDGQQYEKEAYLRRHNLEDDPALLDQFEITSKIQTKFRVWIPIAPPLYAPEHEVMVPWVQDQVRTDPLLFDEKCKDMARLMFTMRHNDSSLRHPWLVMREGEIFNAQSLPGNYNLQKLMEEHERKQAEAEAAKKAARSSTVFNSEPNEQAITQYVTKALQDAERQILDTPEGDRNNKLFIQSYSIGQFVGAGVLAESDAHSVLVSAGMKSGLSGQEANRTFESGLKYGREKPRDLSHIGGYDQLGGQPVNLNYSQPQSRPDPIRHFCDPPQSDLSGSDQSYQTRSDQIGSDQTFQDTQQEVSKDTEGNNSGNGGGNNDDEEEDDDFWDADLRDEIILSGDMMEESESIYKWLRKNNTPPSIFVRDRNLIRLVHVPSKGIFEVGNKAELEEMNQAKLRSYLMRRLSFFKYDVKAGKEIKKNLNLQTCEILLSRHKWVFPQLEEVIRNPILAPDGEIVQADGYRPSMKAWVNLRGMKVNVPENPKLDDVEGAKELILQELFYDFPFGEEASGSNALALFLLPYIRHLIKGPTPLHLISAPQRGAGKTLVVQITNLVATGTWPETMTEGRDDEEWRKRITSVLIHSPTIVCIDNINRHLDSGSLASALTNPIWLDRLMGLSQMANVRNNAIWTATANNPTLSDEIERRCIYIHLDPQREDPENRTGFKHERILHWTLENRKDLLTAALILCRYWATQGMPLSRTHVLASFEEWSSIVGGLLESIGMADEFMNNRNKYQSRTDMEKREWRVFVELWWGIYQTHSVASSDLTRLAADNELLERIRGGQVESKQNVRFGKALSKKQNQIVGRWRIMIDQKSTKGSTYFLEEVILEDETTD